MAQTLTYILALLPGLAWLIYFLCHDEDPEPRNVVFIVFLLGAGAALLIGVFSRLMPLKDVAPFWLAILFAPIFEELIKFAVVRFSVAYHPVCDRRTDYMIYLITAALGFATTENIIYNMVLSNQSFFVSDIFFLSFFRLIGATLLHALLAGSIGFFWAHSKKYVVPALLGAIALHGLFNLGIIRTEATSNPFCLTVPITIIIVLSLFITYAFKKLNNMNKEKFENKPLNIEEAPVQGKEWFEPEGELAVDVYETPEEIIIRSAVAGVKPEDVDVSVDGDMIVIKGERKEAQEKKEANFFFRECHWGKFSRRVLLPKEANPEKISADLKDGILIVRIPRIVETKKTK
jgi:HSP20 family protein